MLFIRALLSFRGTASTVDPDRALQAFSEAYQHQAFQDRMANDNLPRLFMGMIFIRENRRKSSSNAVAASSKLTRCLRRLAVALRSFHVNVTGIVSLGQAVHFGAA
jgi:hypothetical protein